jgi:hypothetical protein
MNEIIFLVEDALEGGFSARALGYSIFTAAETERELHEMVKDAVNCHFDEGEAPKIIRLHSVREAGIQAQCVPTSESTTTSPLSRPVPEARKSSQTDPVRRS